MKNNETGEFELVLGNRQLLSAFFVVAILFGIFFTMGYIVGRNSAPSSKSSSATETAPVGSLAANQSEPRPQSSSAAPPETPTAAAETPSGPSGQAGDSPQPTTRAAQESPAKPTTAAAETTSPALSDPESGQTYLQVMAVKRIDAEVVARTLKEKGFSITLSAARNDLVRVLVGPYADTASLGKAKAELENAGFHPIVRK